MNDKKQNKINNTFGTRLKFIKSLPQENHAVIMEANTLLEEGIRKRRLSHPMIPPFLRD